MNVKMRRMLSVVLSLALALSMLVIPAIPATAQESGEPDVMYICGSDYADTTTSKEVFLYHAETYTIPDDVIYDTKWKGMSFDEKTSTLTLNNVNAPGVHMMIDSRSAITLKVEGTNKLGQLRCDGASKLTVTGTGTLEINAPFTGKIYDDHSGDYKTVSNQNPFYYALSVSHWGDTDKFSLPMLVIGDQVTLKLYGKKYEDAASSGSSSSSSAYCASFSFGTKKKNVESAIIQHSGVATPAVKWDAEYYPVQSNTDWDFNKEIIESVCVPSANLLVENPTISGNTATVTGEEIKDYLYYKYDIYVYRVIQKDGKWFIDKTSNGLYRVNTREVTASDMAVLTGSESAEALNAYCNPDGGLYGSKLKKGNDTYVAGPANAIYPTRVYDNLFKIPNGSYYDFKYFVAKVTEKTDAVYVENVKEIPNATEDTYMDILEKDGYVYEGEYSAYCMITNLSQTFAPKTSGGSQAQPVAPTVGTVDSTGNYTVTGNKEVAYTGKNAAGQKNVTIDSVVKVNNVDCTVTEIADNAFAGNKDMESVSIPASVTSIGEGAFKDCTKLKKVDVPANTETIAKNAFSGCTNMTAVNFKGKKVKSIGDNAFAKCTKLTKATLPDSVTTIGKNAFKGDKKLKSITVSGNLKTVKKGAFSGVKKNAKVIIKTKNTKTYKNLVKKIKKAGNKNLKFSQKKK